MTGTQRCFCTIITRSHLAWALALADSLRVWDPDLPFVILVSDLPDGEEPDLGGLEDIEVVRVADLLHLPMGAAIAAKCADRKDHLRWSLKPVLMEYLHLHHAKVIYGDCDLYFYADPAFIWAELDRADMLLTPHWRSSIATVDRPNFDQLYVGGLYNAGFVASHRRGIPALRHWGGNCLEVCFKDFTKGQCDDQAHLNLLPVYFEGVQVLRHRGCNVANWNMVECARTAAADGAVLINGTFPIVFIHFTRSMIDGIVDGTDGLLMPHLRILRDRLLEAGFGRDVIADSERRLAEKNKEPATSVRARLGKAEERATGGS